MLISYQFIFTIILGYCAFFLTLILVHRYNKEDIHSSTLSMQISSTLTLISLLSIRDFFMILWNNENICS